MEEEILGRGSLDDVRTLFAPPERKPGSGREFIRQLGYRRMVGAGYGRRHSREEAGPLQGRPARRRRDSSPLAGERRSMKER